MSDHDLWPLREQPRAREELLRRYLPLAHRLAARYRNPHEPQDDLDQVAGLALLGAIHRFDPQRGLPFAAFAVPTILGELKKHFRDTGWALHVPRAAAERAQLVQRTGERLGERLGRSPSVAELARELDLDLDLVIEALEAGSARWAISYHTPARADQDEAVDLIEILGDTDGGYELVEARLALAGGLRALPVQERDAVRLRAEEQLTQSEIGRRLGCSQMQVSRMLGRAADQLRSHLDPTISHVAHAGARE